MIDNEQDYIGRDASSDRAEATVWLAVKVLMFLALLEFVSEVIRDGI